VAEVGGYEGFAVVGVSSAIVKQAVLLFLPEGRRLGTDDLLPEFESQTQRGSFPVALLRGRMTTQ
jgi:hypothetical protein